MDMYTSLLEKALANVKGFNEEIGLDSLADPGGTTFSQKDIEIPFELISFLIVK